MAEHDPTAFGNGLSLKLAARSRHVCVFVGAGASKACGLSDIAGLEKYVRNGLSGQQLDDFEHQLTGRNLEGVLTRLRRLAAVLADDGSELDGLTLGRARDLDRTICSLLIDALRIDQADLAPMLRLAAWIARSDYHLPIEVFTVNYDLLIETSLEELSVPCFDGFVGTRHARFRVDLVEAEPSDSDCWLPSFVVRLWKLHGSVDWCWVESERPEVHRRTPSDSSNAAAAIYPSDTKYDESRRVPFVVLQDRLRRALHRPETLTLVTGYSFSDHHLNEMLFDAGRRRPRSEIIVFCFGEIPANLAEQAMVTPNLQVLAPKEAILGGLRRAWVDDPRDAPEDLWKEGTFALGDFANLTQFLARSFPPEGELQSRLAELLAKATES